MSIVVRENGHVSESHTLMNHERPFCCKVCKIKLRWASVSKVHLLNGYAEAKCVLAVKYVGRKLCCRFVTLQTCAWKLCLVNICSCSVVPIRRTHALGVVCVFHTDWWYSYLTVEMAHHSKVVLSYSIKIPYCTGSHVVVVFSQCTIWQSSHRVIFHCVLLFLWTLDTRIKTLNQPPSFVQKISYVCLCIVVFTCQFIVVKLLGW